MVNERCNRYFSESFKRQKVREIERNLISVSQVSVQYEVSRTSVYRWIYHYSSYLKKGVKQVVERRSDTAKIKALENRVKELERAVGQKQLQLDFHQKMFELASKLVGFDIKKKFGSQASSGSGAIEKNTDTK